MTRSGENKYVRERNDALRAELVSATLRTERLVEEGENVLAAQERFYEEFQSRTFTVEIVSGLGSVTVGGDGRITIDLERAKAVISDFGRLGERILAALVQAEKDRDEAALHDCPRLAHPGV